MLGAEVEGQTHGVPLAAGVDGQVHVYHPGSEPAPAGEKRQTMTLIMVPTMNCNSTDARWQDGEMVWSWRDR